MNADIKIFVGELSKAHDDLDAAKLHINDIYSSAQDAGFDKVALKEALKEYLMTPEQLAKKRKREELADQYKMQLKLI